MFVHLSCPHCASVIERYGGAPLRDITDIRTLKQFLAYRDQLGGFPLTPISQTPSKRVSKRQLDGFQNDNLPVFKTQTRCLSK